MSTDEQRLAQWLDAPTSDPEGSVDPEVLEAVYALRPDLAPAPRLTAEDILASVQEGPLAVPGAPASGAVPPPGESDPTAVPTAANRPLASWGGWGGIGLALAAAATFALVGLPTLQSSSPERTASSLEFQEEPAAAAAPREEVAAIQAPAEAEDAPPAPPRARPKRAAPPAPAPAAPPPVQTQQAPPDAYDMAQQAPMREPSLIPELTDAANTGAVADAELGVDAASIDAVAAENARRLDDLRRAATQPAPAVPPWSAGLPSDDVQRLEAIFAEASRAAPRDAGDLASQAIGSPAAVAHHAADLAATYYLQAGDTRAATSVLLRGLQYRAKNARWARLAVRYGDLIRATDPDGAASWYEEAAAIVR